MSRLSGWLAGGVVIAILVGSGWWWLQSDQQQVTPKAESPVAMTQDPDSGDRSKESTGGFLDLDAVSRSAREESGENRSPYGETPRFDPDATTATTAAFESLKQGVKPERQTPLVPPTVFDAAAFDDDPEAYLAVAEPGRVWQSAQPGPKTPALRPAGPRMIRMKQKEAVRLKVVGQPLAPVTFTSFDLGIFENKLPSITVQADQEGLASAAFTAPRGTFNEVNILAASPLASGNVRFVVEVAVPVL